MASEEGRQVLRLLAEGKIDVEQASRLLRALGDVSEPGTTDGAAAEPAPAGARGRTLRIRVTEGDSQKVNIAIPLAIARIGKVKLGGLVRGHLGKFGIDLDEVMREVERTGRVVDVADGPDRVEIFVD